jgi:multidrug efflux pump subunit AcrA (membrane-fusion protein)
VAVGADRVSLSLYLNVEGRKPRTIEAKLSSAMMMSALSLATSEADALLQAPRGVPVTATFSADPSQQVAGKLLMTIPTDGGARIVVETPTPPPAPQPGATASLRIELDRRDDVLRVPSRALHYSPEGSASLPPPSAGWARVWAWRDGTMTPVDVKPGLDDGAFVEIRGGALEVGDRVVVNGESQAPQEP